MDTKNVEKWGRKSAREDENQSSTLVGKQSSGELARQEQSH